ncbi:MAG: cytochrome C oxidase subunit IV family protein, partial [Bdellovibrionales bacterium]|nr:cytochrome C oxidase subunit IV family protein [Bdellovibrionales bacterium]
MAHSNDHDHHIVPNTIFLKVLGTLLVLTALTVIVSSKVGVFNFGAWSILVAMLIASIKATCVVLWFMHVKYEDAITKFYVIIPLFFIGI